MKAKDDHKTDEGTDEDKTKKKIGQNLDTERKPETEEKLEKPKLFCSARLALSITCFFAAFNVAYVRVGISMAFVCMVSPHSSGNLNQKTGEFNWSPAMKGYLFSAAFYGFIAGPFVAGLLSFKYGGKVVLVVGTISSGATNFFLPEAARLNPFLFFGIRVFTGFFCSFTLPAFYDLVSHWIVKEETQTLVVGALVGIPVANIVNFPISSLICKGFGWVWLFYTLAIWMVLWGVVFCFVIFDYPDLCPYITEKELNYLKSRIHKAEKHKIPWRKIVKSVPIYAYIVMHFCINYIYISMVMSIPLLMDSVHHFSLEANGFLSAAPFLGSFIMRLMMSLFFEQLRQKLKVSKNVLRKTFVCTGALLGSIFLFTVTLLSSVYRYWILGCLILALTSLEMCVTGGYLLSFLDLCPSYVNVLTGVANTIGNTAGLISPVVNGLITPHGTREEWNSVFYVNISILLASTTFYLVFGQNRLQYWGLATLPPQITDSTSSPS